MGFRAGGVCRLVWLPGREGTDDIQEVRRAIPLKFFMKVSSVEYSDYAPCTCSIDQYRLDQMTGRIPQRR